MLSVAASRERDTAGVQGASSDFHGHFVIEYEGAVVGGGAD